MRLNLLPSKYRQSPFTVSTPKGRKLAIEPREFRVEGFGFTKFFTNQLPGVPILFVATEAITGCTLHAPGAAFLTPSAAEKNGRKALAAIGEQGLKLKIGLAIVGEVTA